MGNDESNDEPYGIEVEIVNKANLLPERLADALYAKALLTQNDKLLQQAAKLSPNDPAYLYNLLPNDLQSLQMAMVVGMSGMSNDKKTKQDIDLRVKRASEEWQAALDKTLRIDPHYLPALYRDATQKATLVERLRALEQLANIDLENAKPYYMMAAERYRAATEGKTVTKASGLNAFDLSAEEWTPVLELIKKGNSQPVLRATFPRTPSSRDLRVTIKGKVVPQAAIPSFLQIYTHGLGLSLDNTFSSNAVMRQIARQAMWEAQKAYASGRRDEAMETLAVLRSFGEHFSASEPYRLIPFYDGSGMLRMERTAEKQILQVQGNRESLCELETRRLAWRKALRNISQAFEKIFVVDKNVKTSPSDYLEYSDVKAEEGIVRQELKEIGLIR